MFGKIAGWLMGGSVDNIIDKASLGIDKLIYTDEEKAEADESLVKIKNKLTEKVLDFRLKYAEITANQSPARRAIALTVTATWSSLIAFAVIAKFFGKDSFADYCFEVLSANVNYSFLAIIAFYFTSHLLKSAKK